MRSAVAVAVAAALLASGLPAAGAKPKPKAPPAVAGQVLVYGIGSMAVDVTVPKGVSLVGFAPQGRVAPGFARVITDDETWAAVAIVSRTARAGGVPVNAVQVHTEKPDHCPPAFAPVIPPPPPCEKLVEHTYVHGVPPKTVGKYLHYPLPAGTYQVVVSAPPGIFSVALLTFAGVRGTRVLPATRAVSASFERKRAEDLAVAHVTGAFTRKLTAPGIGVVGLWHTAAGNEPGEFTYAECVTPGAAGPLNPDDCVPLGMSGAQPPDQIARRPAFWAGSAGGFTLESWGTGTWQTPVLPAGTYTNSFRVTRGGRGPAAGTFAWWLQADSLKS